MSPELGCANLISLPVWIRILAGSDVLNVFSHSSPDPEKSFPGSGGIMKFPEVSDMMDTGPGNASPEAGSRIYMAGVRRHGSQEYDSSCVPVCLFAGGFGAQVVV